MAHILLSAPDDKPWSWGRHLEVALRESGHEVLFLDFRSAERPNEELLAAAERSRPVLHVAWKGERYRPETLRRLAEAGTYNVLWHPDARTPDWLPPLAEAADLCCVQSRGMLEQLAQAGIKNAQWLMEGITPSCFPCTETTPEDVQRYACDVTVVGTIDRVPGYRERLYALNRLIREGFKCRWWGRKMSFRRNRLGDYFSPARGAWGGGMVWGATYAKACRCARVFLAIPQRPDVPGGLSNRAFWATGVGAFYLSLYRRGMEEFFELGREVVVFHDEDEMVEKVRHYLDHEDERREIAVAGQRRTLENYTNRHTFRRLFAMVAQHGGPAL